VTHGHYTLGETGVEAWVGLSKAAETVEFGNIERALRSINKFKTLNQIDFEHQNYDRYSLTRF